MRRLFDAFCGGVSSQAQAQQGGVAACARVEDLEAELAALKEGHAQLDERCVHSPSLTCEFARHTTCMMSWAIHCDPVGCPCCS